MIQRTTLMMGSSRGYHQIGLSKTLTLLLITCFLTLPSKPDGSSVLRKMSVGSSPPRCVNKCLNCSPCIASQVISQNHKHKDDDFTAKSREESYYLLSWKCKCGDKLFQP